MPYQLTFGQNAQIVPAMILPAVILLIPLVLIWEFADPQLLESEWTPIILTVVYFLSVLFLTLRLVAFTTAKVKISIAGDDSLHFFFPEKNIFHRTDFSIAFQQIINIGEENDKGYDFLYFKTRHKGFENFHISAKENDSRFIAFRSHVLSKEALFNASASTGNSITHKTTYQEWPLKTLALLILLFLFAFPLVSFFRGTNWLNNVAYWVMFVAGTPVVIKVCFQNFKK